jgi:hypothetical protein
VYQVGVGSLIKPGTVYLQRYYYCYYCYYFLLQLSFHSVAVVLALFYLFIYLFYVFSLALQPSAGYGLLVYEVS